MIYHHFSWRKSKHHHHHSYSCSQKFPYMSLLQTTQAGSLAPWNHIGPVSNTASELFSYMPVECRHSFPCICLCGQKLWQNIKIAFYLLLKLASITFHSQLSWREASEDAISQIYSTLSNSSGSTHYSGHSRNSRNIFFPFLCILELI